ncbi:MAG TPA: hypothetical protein VNA25_11760 [Phycisphaerae bacterium]|nr:hypothetical protein [Phycisphaerae bacterium]
MRAKDKQELVDENELGSLRKRVETLEGQLLNCLKFMRYHAEKEARRLDPSYPVHSQFDKAKAN